MTHQLITYAHLLIFLPYPQCRAIKNSPSVRPSPQLRRELLYVRNKQELSSVLSIERRRLRNRSVSF